MDEYNEDQELVELIENDFDQERFIPVPGGSSREGYAQMERFIGKAEDTDAQQTLYKAIKGRGAFRRFKDRLHDVGLVDEWYEFKNREDREKALDWLLVEGLITEEEFEKGMQMYEDTLARRKRRKENLAKMGNGAVVVCSGNAGHVHQITPGTTYKVLDEQKEHQNIRIKDDRGKVIWLPKAHFELVSEP